MRHVSSSKQEENPLALQVKQRLHEGWLILLAVISVYLLIALCSYHASDPGWSATGDGKAVANLAGRFGAWIADLLLSLLGWTAFSLPLLLAYFTGHAWLTDHKLLAKHPSWLVIRSAGFISVVLSLSGLVALYVKTPSAGLAGNGGGIIGELIANTLHNWLGGGGARLILVAGLLCGITLLSGLAWSGVVKHGAANLPKVGKVGVSWWQRRRERRVAKALWRQEEKSARAFSSKKSQDISELPDVEPILSKPLIIGPAEIAESIEPAVSTKSLLRESAKSKLKPGADNPKRDTNAAAIPASLQTGLPSLNLLEKKKPSTHKGYSSEFLASRSRELEQRLRDFGVEVTVVAVHPGPVITRYEMDLAPGVKVSKIVGLAKDLARSMSTVSVRVVEVIPGKSVVGLELPNDHREMVRLREILESKAYQEPTSHLTMGLGVDIAGHPVAVDLAKMPHLLVAGTTGSGKSVGLNAMLLSLLYKATAQEVRLIMVDPKMLELSVYEGIPHLLAPVVTDMKEAANALRWCVAEMDRRYQLMAAVGVRNLAGYNSKVNEAIAAGQPLVDPLLKLPPDMPPIYLEPLPAIVVLIDEFADMMMVVGKKVEELIARLAQKARAAGVHLILATQRPSVDVITGLIKANIPTRMAFQVSSRIDSRTILDQQGAEQLLGHGDMLYLPPGSGVPIRVHGAFVADEEVHRVVAALRQLGAPNYLPDILQGPAEGEGSGGGSAGIISGDDVDPLFDQVVEMVTQARRVSISGVQRRFKIGFNRAARIVDELERAGVVSPADVNGSRDVLAPAPMD